MKEIPSAHINADNWKAVENKKRDERKDLCVGGGRLWGGGNDGVVR